MTITAKVIEDSIAPNGKRLTTFQLQYPRFIHAESKTHRVVSIGDESVALLEEVGLMDCDDLSRNASSSRAIPVNKMIERTLADPAFFVHIGKNQAGMQANEEVDEIYKQMFEQEWRQLAQISARYVARWANEYGIHKQVANRALEPWQHIHVIVTATELDNFYALRDHDDAQPEIRDLARAMRAAQAASTPTLRLRNRLIAHAWHLPYVTDAERDAHSFDPLYLAKLSAARCARVSYLTHDGRVPNADEDLALYERLVGGEPLHASPIEHQAYPLPLASQRSNNFAGWRQNREIVEFTLFN
jgi:hypothetical protein